MKTNRFVCLVAAASLGLGSVSAFAQGHGPRDHDRMGRQEHSQRGPGNRDWDRDHGPRGHEVYHYGARGPEWRRGGRVPAQYRNHQYVVNNWRAHHLSAPPRGYHWVQVGNDYVLAAIATGIIAQLILSNS